MLRRHPVVAQLDDGVQAAADAPDRIIAAFMLNGAGYLAVVPPHKGHSPSTTLRQTDFPAYSAMLVRKAVSTALSRTASAIFEGNPKVSASLARTPWSTEKEAACTILMPVAASEARTSSSCVLSSSVIFR